MTRAILTALVLVPVLSACAGTASTVSDQVRDAMSGATAPLVDAVNEASRRANELGEGINDVREGVAKVHGALSGSGSTW